MNFKKLDIEDRDIFQKFLGQYEFGTYEYSFLTLYFWRKMLNVEYALIDDALIVKKYEEQKGSYFMQPIGYKEESLMKIIEKLRQIKASDASFKNLFRDIELPFLYKLMDLYKDDVCFCEDINNFDYIYNASDLITLKGKKFHRKRNHYNQFVGNYSYEIKDISEPGVINDCIDFAQYWYENRQEDDIQLEYELEGIKEVLPKYQFFGIQCMAVYVGGKIVGFTVGEKINKDMAIIHVEKGDFNCNGVYAFINKTFAEKYLSDVKYINRQEDLGHKGLRKAKMSYNPVKLERKFIVDIKGHSTLHGDIPLSKTNTYN